MDLVDKIIEFETGGLSDMQVIELFAELVRTGVAWTLQGSYGRAAHQLIVGGYIDANGNVLRQLPEE